MLFQDFRADSILYYFSSYYHFILVLGLQLLPIFNADYLTTIPQVNFRAEESCPLAFSPGRARRVLLRVLACIDSIPAGQSWLILAFFKTSLKNGSVVVLLYILLLRSLLVFLSLLSDLDFLPTGWFTLSMKYIGLLTYVSRRWPCWGYSPSIHCVPFPWVE